jgi:membrane associated rhomboid family serine protease
MPQLPAITKALMLICTAVFCVQELLPMLHLSALFALWPLDSGRFWPWQVVTYAFLHGGFSHLIFNMLGLWMFGSEIEMLRGPKRYLQLLLASVITAALAQMVLALVVGSGAVIGASGAIFGLLLAYAMSFPNRQFDLIGLLPMLLMVSGNSMLSTVGLVLYVMLLTNRGSLPFLQPIPVSAMTMAGIYGIIELYLGVTGTQAGVAHFAHLGGMLGAWLMISWWRGKLPFSGPTKRR